MIPRTSRITSDTSQISVTDETDPASGGAAIQERFLRNVSIIDQERVSAHPVAIIGVGAIGSHLAEMLAKLGVREFTLIDFDEVDEVNLGVQGFYERDVGRFKTDAVVDRLKAINNKIETELFKAAYEPSMILSGSAVFSCVDSMKVRRQIFRDFREHDWPIFLDGRMAAESLRAFCIDRTPQSMEIYRTSLFPSHEAHRESCTARATIYCAAMAAAILCAQFKKWAMDQMPEPHIQFDILALDLFR